MSLALQRSTGKRKLGLAQTAAVDLDSDPKYNGDPISKHRTCWMHVAVYLRAREQRIPKKMFLDIKSSAPCLLGNFPRGARSKRRAKCKSRISKPKKKLDTETFDRYLEALWSSFSECKRTSFACLDSLWFALYMKGFSQEKVLSWIKRKQIFSKKYVFVPIVCWSHWSLLIFCHFGESMQSKTRTPCMLLLDSLEMADPRRLEPDIRKFVLDVYRAEGRPENKEMIRRIPLLVPKVPQQRDGEECGNFVLYYMNLFVEGAPENFSIEGYPYFMKKDWFDPKGLDHFCERLKSFGK
ncbi:hypothetical protein SLE2022_295060 [Rubroshorea leprosula]